MIISPPCPLFPACLSQKSEATSDRFIIILTKLFRYFIIFYMPIPDQLFIPA